MNRRSLFAGFAGLIAGAGAVTIAKAMPAEPDTLALRSAAQDQINARMSKALHILDGAALPPQSHDFTDPNGAHSHAIYWTEPPIHQHSVQVGSRLWRSI